MSYDADAGVTGGDIVDNIQENEEKKTENLENTHEFTIENMRFPVSPGSSDDDRIFFTPVE